MSVFPLGQRLDRRYTDPSLYPVTVDVRPRFQDLDPLNHVNNVAMAAMFEDARVRFNQPMKDQFGVDGSRVLVGGVVLNYLAESHFNPSLNFHLGIGHIGTSSWVIQTCAWQGDHPTLLAMATMVRTTGRGPAPLPNPLREMLEERRVTALS